MSNLDPLARIGTSGQAQRAAISGLLVGALALMACQAIPPDFYPLSALHGSALWSTLRKGSSPYATAVGLRQDWMMFAPNPMRQNAYIDAEITFQNGGRHTWTFPQMQELGYLERYAKERYRKFSNENLWIKDNGAVWPDAARYIARMYRDPANPPKTVKLIHYWCLIPDPPQAGEEAAKERWNREVFFTYTVSPGDLH